MKPNHVTAAGGAILAITLALCAAAPPAAAQGLACPLPHAASGPGVLRESPTQLAETGSYLASSADPNRVPETIADLRKRYPGVSDAELENYLVAAYCPQVARLNGLGPAEQRSRVQRFSRQVETVLHAS